MGGLSQLVRGAGQLALGAGWPRRRPVGETSLGSSCSRASAVLVFVGVFAGASGVVAVGSVVLLAALALFAAATSAPRLRCARESRTRLYVHRTVVIFLAGSVLVGTGLAEAHPWQWREYPLGGKNMCAPDANPT
jgi:hypothetical protein